MHKIILRGAIALACHGMFSSIACARDEGATATLAASSVRSGLVQTVNAAADTYVKSGSPNQAQGAETFLRVQDTGKNRSLVRFNQSNIADAIGADTLVSAAIELTIAGNGNNWGLTGRTLDAHRVTIAWTKVGGTWNCAADANPSNSSADCSGATAWSMGNASLVPWEAMQASRITVVNNQTGVVQFDVTADVLAFMQGTKANHGFVIKKSDEGATGRMDFASRESANAPRLLLVTSSVPPPPVPPPQSATLNASGDTYLRSGTPNANQGSLLTLRLQASGDNRSLVQFDHAALVAAANGRIVTAAHLELAIADNGANWGGSGATVDAYRLTHAWTENGATWNCSVDSNTANGAADCSGAAAWDMTASNPLTRPYASLPTSTVTITNASTGFTSFDVTTDVLMFLAAAPVTPDYGWVLRKTSEAAAGRIDWASRETSSPPRLVLTFLPNVNDGDGDGVANDVDNCVDLANANQANADGDDFGDACDDCPLDANDDEDNDGHCADADNCPIVPNEEQDDGDSDGVGDLCDACVLDPNNDADADDVCGNIDNCPALANTAQTDGDNDAVGDPCDICPNDADNDGDVDGLCADEDNCALVANADQGNADADAFGDVCDACPNDADDDVDGDEVCGDVDNCPVLANTSQANADADSAGDLCDPCPLDPANDADGDGFCGDIDNCPGVENANQADGDDDGIGDECDCDQGGVCIPPDPSLLAGPIDPTIVSQVAATAGFLLEGEAPVQRGAAPGALQIATAALLRGRVLDGAGNPLPGVKVSVAGKPEIGFTRSRTDGAWDLAVPGNAEHALRFSNVSHTDAFRTLRVRSGDVLAIADIVVVERGAVAGSFDFDVDAPPAAIGDGGPTLLVNDGISAEAQMTGGGTVPLDAMTVRVTDVDFVNEPRAISATLPAGHEPIAFVDVRIDELAALGAESVHFDPPLPMVLANSASLPVGENVFVGRFDVVAGAWVAAPNARVIEILGADGQGRANVDIDGTSAAATDPALTALGFTDDERVLLAETYASGTELVRALLPGFSLISFALPGIVTTPLLGPTVNLPPVRTIEGCAESEIVKHREAIADTTLGLSYTSERAEAVSAPYELEIPLVGADLPPSVASIDVDVSIAGRLSRTTFAPSPNLAHYVSWDGLDLYGRRLQGVQRFTAQKTYNVAGTFEKVARTTQFGGVGTGIALPTTTRLPIPVKVVTAPLDEGVGSWDAKRAHALGNFVIDAQHVANPLVASVLRGDGSTSNAFLSIVTTVAGSPPGGFSGDNGPAPEAKLNDPRAIATAPDGSIFLSDSENHRIRVVDTNGIIGTYAGGGAPADTLGDGGDALSAKIENPSGMVRGDDGVLYVAEPSRHRVRRVDDSTGTISTFAGTGVAGYSGDGAPASGGAPANNVNTIVGIGSTGFSGDGAAASLAEISNPSGIAVAPDGTIYFADSGNFRIRKIDTAGLITTIAGSGSDGDGPDDVAATASSFSSILTIALDPDTNTLYVTDTFNCRIRRIDLDAGTIHHFAGVGFPDFSDGDAASSAMTFPEGIALAPDGSLYVADTGNCRIRHIADGFMTTVAGSGVCSSLGNNVDAGSAAFRFPRRLTVDTAGNVYVADGSLSNDDDTVRRIDAITNVIATVAGGGLTVPGFGAATDMDLGNVSDVLIDELGDLYIASLSRVFRVDLPSGLLIPFAGTGDFDFSGDGGNALDASFFGVNAIAAAEGALLIADGTNNRIRAVAPAVATVNTIAGDGNQGFDGDNQPALEAALYGPSGIAIAADGTIYFADTENFRIRRIDPVTAIITTIAGTGSDGDSGDDGPAIDASFSSIFAIALDPASNSLYLADTFANRIRRIDLGAGTIHHVAGTGVGGFSDGPAATSKVRFPQGIAVGPDGSVFIADTSNCRIRRIAGGVMSTIAGSSVCSSLGNNGPAPSASFRFPRRVHVNGDGDVFIGDGSLSNDDDTVRRIDAATNIITRVAGGGAIVPGSGSATSMDVGSIADVTTDASGNLYIASAVPPRVFRVDLASGQLSPFAGTGAEGFSGDGAAAVDATFTGIAAIAVRGDTVVVSDGANNRLRAITATPSGAAKLNTPTGLALGPDGALFIADVGNAVVRRIDSSGIINTVVGNGLQGAAIEGVNALSASLSVPFNVAVDGAGRIYVVETEAHRVRRVGLDGRVFTVAGNGLSAAPLLGARASRTSLGSPTSVAPLASGAFYVASAETNEVYFVDERNIISLHVGNGGEPPTTPPPDIEKALSTSLQHPGAIHIAADGTLLIAELAADRIRRVSAAATFPVGAPAQVTEANGETLTFDADGRHVETLSATSVLTTFDYDGVGFLETVTVSGAASTVIRDGFGVASVVRSENGVDTEVEMDIDGNLVDVIRPDGYGSVFGWASDGLLTRVRGHLSGHIGYTYDANGCAALERCGNGVVDAGEACDDGAFNSNGQANACRLDCTTARCGDGTVDDDEACDDGGFTGPGSCNDLCTFFEDATLTDFEPTALNAAPAGTIGVLMSQRSFEPLCLVDEPDFTTHEEIWDWLSEHDFIVGMRVEVNEYINVHNVVALYEPNYMGRRAIRVPTQNATAMLETFALIPGDQIVVDMRGGLNGQCNCSSGGSRAFEFCNEQVPEQPPNCDSPTTECPEFEPTFTYELTNNSFIQTVPGEPALLNLTCGLQCHLAGMAGICGPQDPPVGPGDVPDQCSFGPSRVDPLCQAVAGVDGSVSSCLCHGTVCEGLGEMNEGATGIDNGCMIQINPQCTDDANLFADIVPFTSVAGKLRQKLGSIPLREAWAYCTSGEGRALCSDVIPNQPRVKDQANDGTDDTLAVCGLSATSNISRCLLCGDRAGGACFLAVYEDRKNRLMSVIDDINEMMNMEPAHHYDTSADVNARRLALADSHMRNPLSFNARNGQLAADPVLLSTGELVMDATDVSFPSRGVPIELTRYYRSGGDWYGTLGPGWTHTYEELIEPIGYMFNRQNAPSYCTSHSVLIGCLLRHRADGGSELYVYEPSSNTYVPQPGTFGVMRVLTDDEANYGFELFEPGGVVRRYDIGGVLESIKDAEGFGVELSWELRDPERTRTEGCRISQKPHSLFDRFLAREESALSGAVLESIHRLCQMELRTVTDSFGRELTFEYESKSPYDPLDLITNPMTRHGPYNRSVLKSVSYRNEVLVSYEYTPLNQTNEAYLTHVKREGMSVTMEPATPIVTEYEYQHDIISAGGALAEDGELRQQVDSLVEAMGIATALCRTDVTVPNVADSDCQPAIQAETAASGITASSTDYWSVIEEMLADNIVRVRRGGSEHSDIELESFFDPDPTSGDFDRVVKQRYGADSGETASTEVEVDAYWGGVDPLFHWQLPATTQAKIFHQPFGSLPNVGNPEPNAPSPRPHERNRFVHENRALPEELNDLPLVAHDAPEDGGSRCDLSEMHELPFFDIRQPAGRRTLEDLDSEPTIGMTPHSCAEIAGRHALDPFLNDLHDPIIANVDSTGLLGKRRKALAWDAALVCRWVQLDDRHQPASTSTYGLNFLGQSIVEVHPSPTGAGNVVTKRRFNADGLLVEEEQPDGSRVTVTYGGESSEAGATLFRALPTSVTETPSAVGVVNELGQPVNEDRVTTFTYEPLFQQLSTVHAPDGTVTKLYYDYQQMNFAEPLAERLLERLQRSTGQAVTVFDAAFFKNQDLDGDGRSGIESSSQLVLTVVEDVDVGDASVDVGERITRDDCGEVTDTFRIKDWQDPGDDTDRVEVLYYRDLESAEAGSEEMEQCRCACGPQALTRKYRSPDANDPNDLDEVKVAYDSLGGARESVANEDNFPTTVTVRNSVGLIIEEQRPNDLKIARTYDARGQLRTETTSGIDIVDEEPVVVKLSEVTYAWGNQGVALGSCRSLVEGACDDFQSHALAVLRAARANGTMPAALPDASFSIPLLDDEDIDVGFIDATGARTDRIRNLAGYVESETVVADPNPSISVTYEYDLMGRVLAETRGGEIKQFFRYDGFGRVTDAQSNAGSVTEFTPGQGTIATTRYDLLDRPAASFVFGSNGAGGRRVLGMTRSIRNELGAPLFVHALAQSTLPSSLPALPSGGIANGDVWATEELTYDHALRVSSHLPEGRTVETSAQYDGFGVTTIVSPTHEVTIDVVPRQRARTSVHSLVPEGVGAVERLYSEHAEWDPAGNTTLTTMVDPDNDVERTSTATFDALGRIRNAIDPTGRVTALTFDFGGRLTTRTEKVGTTVARATDYAHDAMGRVVLETPEEAPPTTHAYDKAGQPELMTSGEGEKAFETRWAFDSLGRIAERTTLRGIESSENPKRVTEWTYPANRASPSALTVDSVEAKTWTRDGLDRPVVATDANVTDGSDPFNESRPLLKTSLTYDTLGRVLVDETHGTFPSTSPTLPSATAELLSRATWARSATFLGPSSITTLNGEGIEYSYSPGGALTELKRTRLTASRTISLATEGGQWTKAVIGDVTVSKERDAFGFVTSSSVATANDGTVFEETVLRGPTGRITADRRAGVLFSDRARSYRYDALQRLTEFKVDTATAMTRAAFVAQTNAALADEEAGFAVLTSADATVTLSATKADVLTSASTDHEGRSYSSVEDADAAGVPLTIVNAQAIDRDLRDRIEGDGELTYTWDVFDRLALVVRDGDEELRIAYDGIGRRRLERRLVTTPTGDVTEDAVLEYAGANVIEEYEAGGSDVYLTVTHAPGIDTPLLVAAGATTLSPTTKAWAIGTNARGDASSAVNLDTQLVDEEAILDPWGEREVVGATTTVCVEGGEDTGASRPTGGCANESAVLQRFGLAGARLHARTKLVDMRNRTYATHLRAFLTKDPLGNIDSEGQWNYVAGDPINLRDPFGLTPNGDDPAPAVAEPPEQKDCINEDCTNYQVLNEEKREVVNRYKRPCMDGGVSCGAAALQRRIEAGEQARERANENAASRQARRAEALERSERGREDLGRELARMGKTTADLVRDGWAADSVVLAAHAQERNGRLGGYMFEETVGNAISAVLPVIGKGIGGRIAGAVAKPVPKPTIPRPEIILFHGSDVGSVGNMVDNGLDQAAARALGGGDIFWTTTDKAIARFFAQANPAEGAPAILGMRMPAQAFERLKAAGVLEIDEATGAIKVFDWDTFGNNVMKFFQAE